MSIKVCIYVPSLADEVVPTIAARFCDLGMECQFDQQFSLNPSKDSGMISVRLRVHGSDVPQYANVDMLSGFEISFKDFQYASPVSVNPAINQRLKGCTKQVIIRMHANPTSSLRTGCFFAAFLAEVCAGVVYTPRSDQYFEPSQALEQLSQDVVRYEAEVPPQDWAIAP